jgi:hypothetical protein
LARLDEPPADLRGFPESALSVGRTLYRIHLAANAPWWFSSDGLGRFNLDPPNGTCYLTFSPVGAFVEVFGHIGRVGQGSVDARRLATLHLPTAVRLADCTSPRAAGFGATAAIHSSDDYDLTRRWAERWHNAGFGGVKYFCGYDPSQQEVAVAVFGDAGLGSWSADPPEPISRSLLDSVEVKFGIRVWPTP